MTNSTQTSFRARPVLRTVGLGTSQWIFVDAALWAAMFVIALWMRYDFSVDQLSLSLGMGRFYVVLIALIALTGVTGWLTGLYRGRYVPGSALESTVLTFVFATASVIVFLGNLAGGQYEAVPRSNPVVAGAFTILSALVLRSLVRRKTNNVLVHDVDLATVGTVKPGDHAQDRRLARA